MQPVSYTFSSLLSEHIAAIDILRTKILTVPLTPHIEHELRWASTISSIHGSLALSRLLITRAEVIGALTQPKPSTSQTGITVMAYANALRWINQYWTGNPVVIQTGDIAVITTIALSRPHHTQSAFTSQEKDITAFCRYLNSQNDHPVITAGLMHWYFLQSPLGAHDRGKIARLMSATVLAKSGYDLRGLAHPETMWATDPKTYEFTLEQATQLGQLTPWLEYIAASMKTTLIQLLTDIENRARGIHKNHTGTESALSRRQQDILDLTAAPDARLTNRIVQSRFHISAITASRDLAKLHALGLLYAHGKGRSVYYTKV